MGPLARVLNCVLVQYNSSLDVTTYRGSQLTMEQFAHIEVGHKYRVGMFVASSLDYGVAESFVVFEKNRVIVELRIPKHCFNAGFLGVEYFSEREREFLMPPYSVVEIEAKGRIGP